MNDSYQLENDNSSNGYHPLNNNNNNFIDSSPKRRYFFFRNTLMNINSNECVFYISDSPLDDNNRRSRSRSFDRHSNNNNRRSYSRSRSPRNRNQDYSNDNRQSRRNDNRNRNSNSGSGSRYTDRELGLKYRWEKTVFVSNIPYDVKWPELKDLFKSKIGEIHFCEIFERDNKSLGVGTIEFKLLEDAEKAVELMNQYDLGTRKISVRMDSDGSRTRKYKEMTRDFGRQNQSNYDNQQQSQQTANLLSAINSTSLLAALGLGNNGQQTSPVSPSNASSSSQALNTQNILSLLTQLGSSNNSNMNNNNNNNNSSPNQVNLLNQLAQQNKIEGPVTNRIFVASLDYKVDEYKIREVFSLAGTVLNVSLFKDRDGKSRGMSVIEYTTPTQALNAVLMFNNQVLNNRTMNVRFDTKPPGKDDDGFQQSSSKLPSIY
jgi:RNA recognition motif-containing protein